MKELIIIDNHTRELLVTASNVIDWSIHKDMKTSQWIFNIMYFDEGIEQDNRDTMALCAASSDKWKDDLIVHLSEQ